MKFLTNIIQISSSLSPNLAGPCGAPNIPGPSHRLFYRYSRHHTQLPTNDGPGNVCPKQGTLAGEDATNGLSAFLQGRLCSTGEDIQHACGCGPCSPHPLVYGRSPNRTSGPKGPDSAVVGLPSAHRGDVWSPTLCGNSNYLSNGNSCGNPPFHKTKTFIETKVAAMKLQSFNH